MTDIQKLFAANLRNARAGTGLSQAALAERCELTSNYISELEAGRRFPSHETLQKLCAALDLRPYQLFIDTEVDFRSLEPLEYQDLKEGLKSRLKELLDGLN